MKLHFLTFANTDYMNPTRILSEAASFGVFDRIRHMTEHDIPEFIKTHKNFIDSHPDGYGHYIWKPKVILEALSSMKENDILLYCDAGMKLNINGLSRFHEYLHMLDDPDRHMLMFSMNDSYVPQFFVKQDAIMAYFPEFANQTKYKRYYYAGVMFVKKTEKTLVVLREWLALCENYELNNRNPSKLYREVPGWQGNDLDCGLLNLVVAKHNIHAEIYPDETNLYTPTGIQDYDATDWSSLDAYPLQYRRLRIRTFDTRENMIATLVPIHGVYAEIGVFKGEFADFLAKTLSPSQLVLIDYFDGLMGSGDKNGNNFEMVDLGHVYKHLSHMSTQFPALKVLKGDSVAMLSTFPDNTFDMIYIDADHSYEGSKRDIEVAFRKVKHHGWIMGHDYEMNMKKAHRAYEFGVKQAVDEFCEQNNQRIYAKGLDGCVSFAIKVNKA